MIYKGQGKRMTLLDIRCYGYEICSSKTFLRAMEAIYETNKSHIILTKRIWPKHDL